jgi:peptidoglycan/LPS O-acetylase OafA/YrhL
VLAAGFASILLPVLATQFNALVLLRPGHYAPAVATSVLIAILAALYGFQSRSKRQARAAWTLALVQIAVWLGAWFAMKHAGLPFYAGANSIIVITAVAVDLLHPAVPERARTGDDTP